MHRKRLFIIAAMLCLALLATGCTNSESKNNNQDNEMQQANTSNRQSVSDENENENEKANKTVADNEDVVTTTKRDDGQVSKNGPSWTPWNCMKQAATKTHFKCMGQRDRDSGPLSCPNAYS